MPTNIYWYYGDSVIYIQSINRVTLPENLDADTILMKMMNDSKSKNIHFIYDTRKVNGLPSITNMRNTQYYHHPRLQFSVMVGMNPGLAVVMRALINLFRSKFRDKVYFAKTIDEGITWLISQAPELSDMTHRDIETLSPYIKLDIPK